VFSKKKPKDVGEEKKKILSDIDKRLNGHFPMDPSIPNFAFNQETALKIAAENEGLMNKGQIIMVNMSPWHGPSMDV